MQHSKGGFPAQGQVPLVLERHSTAGEYFSQLA